jgi:hypothetical protein
MVASMNRYVAIPAIALLGFAVLLSWATPASAASLGLTAACPFTSTTRAQCNFPALSAMFNAEIHYVTAQRSSTGVPFNLKQVEILAIPPNESADVGYQMAGNRASVASVANAASNVEIYVKINTTSAVLIDFNVAPTGTTSCTASLAATY